MESGEGISQEHTRDQTKKVESVAEKRNIRCNILPGERLNPHREIIEQRFLSAVEKIAPILDIHDVTVTITDGKFPENWSSVYGYAPDAHTVSLGIDPDQPEFLTNLDQEMLKSVSHELHHTKRWTGPGFGNTLLGALVAEGLAQHFEEELGCKDKTNHTYGIAPEKLSQLRQRATEVFDDPHYPIGIHSKWFWQGSEEEGIPYAAGYAIGYQLVGEYLQQHPNESASSLALTPPEEFVQK